MKLSIITVCWNSAAVIKTALESVLSQASSPDGSAVPRKLEIEYIVVDGGSTDGTVEILKEYDEKLRHSTLNTHTSSLITFRYLSERDAGMYDAMNKGIRMSTGDVIGILNADDVLASDDVLAKVAAAFASDPSLDGTYADIRFVRDPQTSDDSRLPSAQSAGRRQTESSEICVSRSDLRLRSLPTSRYCSGKRFRPWMFRFGTQTAHPSTFFRRSSFDRWGFYSLDYGMFGDFELLCRFIWRNKAKMRYLPLCTTVMRAGGASTNGWRTTLKINRTDLRALKANGCWSCYAFLYARYFFKIWGFLFK